MKKKQIIGLCTLLLVLLLGLSTTSYASGYKLSRSDTDKIGNTYNYSDAKKTGFWNAINDAQSNYDTIVVNCYNANYGTWKVTAFNASQVTAITNVENINYMSVTCSGTTSVYVNDAASYYKSDKVNATMVFGSGSQYRSAYMFISNNFYTYENAPWENIQIVGPFKLPLTFIPKLTNTYADVWTYEDVPFYNASGEDLYLGQLLQPNTYQGYKTSTIFYWQYGNWQFKELTDYATYSVYVGTENGSSIYDIYLLRDYINENMLYDITFTDITTEPLYTLAKCVFYIKNNYTVINNGVLDTSNTFSGDYKDKYDDDLQNEQDINNISEAIDGTINNDDDVDNILSGFNSSGDILESLGYSPIENPFTTVILDVIEQLTDVLLGSGNVTLDISAFELEMILNSKDFVLPDGLIKDFVSLVSNGFLIWIIYKYGFKIYMMINTGKFKNLINETTNTDISLF